MELDPIDTVEQARQTQLAEQNKSRLNVLVAITVALLATFMGICKVKDDNIVQAMQQAQVNKLDHWAFYQARNIREDVARATLLQLQLALPAAPASSHAAYGAAISHYEKFASEQKEKKEELRTSAVRDQREYDDANFRDDQFDLSDTFLAISVALLAVTALSGQKWLYGLSLLPTAMGVVMGLAGLCQWPIHPSWLVKLVT